GSGWSRDRVGTLEAPILIRRRRALGAGRSITTWSSWGAIIAVLSRSTWSALDSGRRGTAAAACGLVGGHELVRWFGARGEGVVSRLTSYTTTSGDGGVDL
ncbi:hypothetical protein PMAYCL1PPCAC_03472, partial [Pristionchus mayeri]